jgi:hypothetical protein
LDLEVFGKRSHFGGYDDRLGWALGVFFWAKFNHLSPSIKERFIFGHFQTGQS